MQFRVVPKNHFLFPRSSREIAKDAPSAERKRDAVSVSRHETHLHEADIAATLVEADRAAYTPLTITSDQFTLFRQGRVSRVDSADRERQVTSWQGADSNRWSRSGMGEQSVGFVGGLSEHVFDAYHSPLDLSAAFLDRSSSLAKEKSVHYREVEERFRGGGHEISRAPTSGFTKWERDFLKELEHKATVSSTVSGLYKLGAVGIGFFKAGNEISEAKPGEKVRTAELAGAELLGVEIGSFGCDAAVGGALVLAGVTDGLTLSLVPTAAMVGCGAVTGYETRKVVEHGLDAFDQQPHSSSYLALRKQ